VQPLKVFVYDSGEDKPFTSGRYAMPTAIIEAAGGKT
jgi:iron complex transport system substrate-binding protein